MHILIPYDITTTGMKNPYLFLLLRELVKHEHIERVTYGYGWLKEDIRPDIIHLHWPELLVKSLLPDMSRVDLLTPGHFSEKIHAIKSLKEKGSKVVITIHNERPHIDPKNQFSDFYNRIYELADGFIHMGTNSKKLLNDQFQLETRNKPSFVIPHGNYDYFPDDMDRELCRSSLNIEPHQKLILTFGAIRTEKELNLGLDAFLKADVDHSIYMMAGQLPYPYKSQWKHFKTRRKLYRHHFNNRIRAVETVISPREVQIYLKSSDLIFIPRFNTLNSGNVALGFTFGKVVAGPDYGVIGEILGETGNPVFDPSDLNDVAESLRSGIQSASEGLGKKNQLYASEKMSWDRVTEMTVKSYRSLLTDD